MKKNKVSGFSLIEVLIAIVIVALTALVSLPLFSIGNRNVHASKSTTEKLFEVESVIEIGNNEATVVGIFVIDENLSIPIRINTEYKDNVSITYFIFDK